MSPARLSRLRPGFAALVLFALAAGPGCATYRLNFQSIDLLVAYDCLRDGQYEDATARLAKAEAKTDLPPETRSEIAYVKGLVLEGRKMLPEAIAQYRDVVAVYPNTPDGYLSRKRLKVLEGGSPSP